MERAHGEFVDFVSEDGQIALRGQEDQERRTGQYYNGTNAIAHRGAHGWYIKIDHYASPIAAPSKEDPIRVYGPGGCFPQRSGTSLALLWNTNIWSCVAPVHGCTLHVFNSSGSRTAVLERGAIPSQTPPRLSRSSHVTTVHPEIFCASVRDIVLNPIELVVVINALFVLPVRMSVHHFSIMLKSYQAKAIIVTQEGMRNVHGMLVINTQSASVAECRSSAWPENTIFVDDESDETISLVLFNTSRTLEIYSLQASKPDVYIQFPRPITVISKNESVGAGTTYLRIRGSEACTQLELYLFDNCADDKHIVPSFNLHNLRILCDVVSLQKGTPQYERMQLIHLASHASFDPIGLMGDQVGALIEKHDSDLDSATHELVKASLLTLQDALQQSRTKASPYCALTSSGLMRQTSVHWHA